ncbi:cobalt ABC transporter, inner membrane subunit CbiQ [Methanocaldococcus infernus ME]|uniref:Cobalt ABC transporter, inner membrane subunit CbiQ n=1 Tax=Methanocaldococcus infernus (strain DSM 11812 / JCM 15783 / ME) TaxID=573063 RepID=D5VRD5_METIM|nr:cobalt ECF transporter T component CbiQ [Methanocaldococcus infernus]ADG13138.1 cobalt ABC transporter, inner membrane subunit CbiQ [Methanocaldococcus infernus ME]
MHRNIRDLERLTLKRNFLSSIHPKIKLISIFLIIIYINLQNNIISSLILELYLLSLLALSNLLTEGIKRIILILPFGLFLSAIQPFIRGETIIFKILYFPVYYEGLVFALLLFTKFLVAVTGVILLSISTPMHSVIKALRGLGLPNIMALLLGIMVRYLYLMFELLEKMLIAWEARGFNRKNLKYKEVLKIFGYSVGSLLIRAYEQGERTYLAMVSRGYSENSDFSLNDEKIEKKDYYFLILTIFVIILSYIVSNLYTIKLL